MSNKRWAAEDFETMAKYLRELGVRLSLAYDLASMAELTVYDLRSLVTAAAQRDRLAAACKIANEHALCMCNLGDSSGVELPHDPDCWVPEMRAALASLEQKL